MSPNEGSHSRHGRERSDDFAQLALVHSLRLQVTIVQKFTTISLLSQGGIGVYTSCGNNLPTLAPHVFFRFDDKLEAYPTFTNRLLNATFSSGRLRIIPAVLQEHAGSINCLLRGWRVSR